MNYKKLIFIAISLIFIAIVANYGYKYGFLGNKDDVELINAPMTKDPNIYDTVIYSCDDNKCS